MEPITNLIKQSSRSITAPSYIKSNVMSAVTNLDRTRTTNEARTSRYTASPFITIFRSKAFVLTSTFALVCAFGLYTFSSLNERNSSDIMELLVTTPEVSYAEFTNIELIQQEMDIINELLALESAVSMINQTNIG